MPSVNKALIEAVKELRRKVPSHMLVGFDQLSMNVNLISPQKNLCVSLGRWRAIYVGQKKPRVLANARLTAYAGLNHLCEPWSIAGSAPGEILWSVVVGLELGAYDHVPE